MADGGLKSLIGGAVGALFSGPVGTVAETLAEAAFKKILGQTWDEVKLHARAYLERPLNHDLERTLRFAALVASLAVVNDQGLIEEAERADTRGAPPDAFTPAARRWLHGQLRGLAEVPKGAHAAMIAPLEACLDAALVAARDPRDAADAAHRRGEAEAAMWSDLTAGLPDATIPEDFPERFCSDDPDRPGWFAYFIAFLRECLKDQPDPRIAFFVSGLSALKNAARRIEVGLDEVKAGVGRVETDVADLKAMVAQLLAHATTSPAPGAEQRVGGAVESIAAGAAADDRLARALALLANGRTTEATTLLRAVAEDRLARIAQDRREAATAFRNLGAIAGLRDPKAALDAYRQAATLDPDDTESQLWAAWLEKARGDRAAARPRFEALLARDALPDRTRLYAIIGRGDILTADGAGAGALAAYRDAMAIRERLAAADPANAAWQRDLIVSCVKLAEAAPAEAVAWLTRGLAVARALEAAGRLAPVDAWMPAELARRLRTAGGAPP